MATISLKAAWRKRFGDTLAGGLRSQHPFYTADTEIFPQGLRDAAFPYKTVRRLIRSLDWPQLRPPFDHPGGGTPGWSEVVQGVAHDADHWYFSQEHQLWRFPVTHDLDDDVDDKPFKRTGIPAELSRMFGMLRVGYDHFGDLDFFDGRLHVPLEGMQPPLLCLFTTNLAPQRFAPLTHQHSAPWCAVNPRNGLLYSSNFHDAGGAAEPLRLYVYKPHPTAISTRTMFQGTPLEGTFETFDLPFVGSFQLRDESGNDLWGVRRIQGGAFSPGGHLYLVSDRPAGGLMGFDLSTGRRTLHKPVEYSPGFDEYEELEGITVWDLEAGRAPGIHGQLHLVMLDNDSDLTGTDDIYLKHFEVASPEQRTSV